MPRNTDNICIRMLDFMMRDDFLIYLDIYLLYDIIYISQIFAFTNYVF